MNPSDEKPVSDDEAGIVSGLARGERTAWEMLYDQYSVRVWRYVARLVGADSQTVAEIVQEVFLSAARSARGFDAQRGTLWSWLVGIAQHAVSRHRRCEVRAHRTDREVDRTRATHGVATEPELLIEQVELAECVREVLAQLPGDYAALLLAKYVDGLEVVEIQSLHGGTHEAVRSKLARARREFREMYERRTGF